MLLCVELKQKERRECVRDILYFKNGGNGGGKKKPGREGTAPRPLPCPGVGRAVGERKEVPPPAVVGGERGQAVLGLVGSVKLWQEAYFFVECVVEK